LKVSISFFLDLPSSLLSRVYGEASFAELRVFSSVYTCPLFPPSIYPFVSTISSNLSIVGGYDTPPFFLLASYLSLQTQLSTFSHPQSCQLYPLRAWFPEQPSLSLFVQHLVQATNDSPFPPSSERNIQFRPAFPPFLHSSFRCLILRPLLLLSKVSSANRMLGELVPTLSKPPTVFFPT